MGKRYYCDYCCKTFKDTLEIKRNHIKGAQHKLIVKEHYQKYKGNFCFLIFFMLKFYIFIYRSRNNLQGGNKKITM